MNRKLAALALTAALPALLGAGEPASLTITVSGIRNTNGALIACVWAWLLATKVFVAGNLHADFSVPWGIVGGGLGIMALLTLTAGWIFSRGVTRHPPLAILREL